MMHEIKNEKMPNVKYEHGIWSHTMYVIGLVHVCTPKWLFYHLGVHVSKKKVCVSKLFSHGGFIDAGH